MNQYIKHYQAEIIGIIICLGLGMLSGYLSNSGDSIWYSSLIKPSFNPPSWVFAPVWTVLYIIIGIVMGKLWKSRATHRLLLTIFCIQLILNLSWSPLFFYLHRIDLALYDIIALWLTLMIFMILSYRIKSVFLLNIPYIAWVSLALSLNFYIYQMN